MVEIHVVYKRPTFSFSRSQRLKFLHTKVFSATRGKMHRVFLIGIVMLYTMMNAEGDAAANPGFFYQKEKLHETELFAVDLATDFSAEFFQTITENPMNPRINSPLNTFILESLLAYGAGGASVKNYHEAIGLPEKAAKKATKGYRSMLEKLSKYDVNIKTKLFVQERVKLNPRFERLSTEIFRAEIEPIGVSDGFIDAERISEFIEGQTSRKLKPRTGPQALGCNTSIVLVNTANFEGTWKIGFNRSDTSVEPFTILGWQTVKIPTMKTTGSFKHGTIDIDGVEAKFIEIPYESTNEDDTISLFIIMTDVADAEGWKKMIPKLRNTDLTNLLNSREDELELFMPKFRFLNTAEFNAAFESESEPQEPYDKNNISKIFASPEPSIISSSYTKSVIDVDETGLRTAQFNLISYSPRPCDICDFYTERLSNCRLIAEVTGKECKAKRTTSSDRQTRSAVRQFRVDRPFVGLLMTTGHIFMNIFSINSPGSHFINDDGSSW